MLTIYLGENLACGWLDANYGVSAPAALFQSPSTVLAGTQIEGQGNGRAVLVLNVSPKVQTVLWIEPPLVTAAGILVQNVCEAEGVKELGRGEPDEDLLVPR